MANQGKNISDETQTLRLFARWTPKKYTVDINANETLDATSLAYYKDNESSEWRLTCKYTVEVYFDSTQWINLSSILMDRYGFTYKGLYPTTDSDDEITDETLFNLDLFKIVRGVSATMNNQGTIYQNYDSSGDNRITLYAQWKANVYNVVLSYNDANCIDKDGAQLGIGSTTIDSTLESYTTQITLGSVLNFTGTVTRKGYDFVGWIIGDHDYERVITLKTDTTLRNSLLLHNQAEPFKVNYQYLSKASGSSIPYLYSTDGNITEQRTKGTRGDSILREEYGDGENPLGEGESYTIYV